MRVYAPVVIQAVGDCLRTFYWFKNDLRAFLKQAGVPPPTVAALPWDPPSPKRTAIQMLLDGLVAHPAEGMPILDRLIDAIVEQDERFPHLARLDDGRRKVADARDALHRLTELLDRRTLAERAERARKDRRTEAERAKVVVLARQADVSRLQAEFLELSKADDHRARGYRFQELLRKLFALHDLDPRGSFGHSPDQVDGSISVDGTHLLVEARWTAALSEPKDVRDFAGKVQARIENTLGLMISMAGFTEGAVAAARASGRFVVILMEGTEVARIFQGLDDLPEVLRRKLRMAADEGRPLHRAWD